MTTQVSIFLPRAAADALAPPHASPPGSDREWYLAEVFPKNLLNCLREEGLNTVAFLRYHVAALLGLRDVRVYLDKSCGESHLADTTLVFSRTRMSKPESFWICGTEPLDEQVTLPVHPKDASTKKLVSLPGGKARWAGPDTEGTCDIMVRDSGSCQISGVEAGRGRTQLAHIIPRRRGEKIFGIIAELRASDEPNLCRGTLDSVRNLVTLASELHHHWDNQKLLLLPLPNVGFDSHGQPLGWERSAAAEQDPAMAWHEPRWEMRSGITASGTVPIVRCLWYATKAPPQPTLDNPKPGPASRLRGPYPAKADLWPSEWAWSYRLAAQIAALSKTPDLTSQLQAAWLEYDEDANGSVVTATSYEGADTSSDGHDGATDDTGAGSGKGSAGGGQRKRPRQGNDETTPRFKRQAAAREAPEDRSIPLTFRVSHAAINRKCRTWAAQVAASNKSESTEEGESAVCGAVTYEVPTALVLEKVWTTAQPAAPDG